MATQTALPKYIQVSERLIREIAAGHLVDGARLPPERDMARDLEISVGTLRKALHELEAQGLLERVQGSGNYIRHKTEVDSVYAFFRLERVGGGGLPTAQVLEAERREKPKGAPDFGPASDAHRIRRLRYLDDVAVALEEIWLDGDCADAIAAADLSESLYRYYRERLNLVIAVAEDRVGVAAVPGWAPEDFARSPGETVGYIERVSQTADQARVEYSRTWFDHEKARYISRMGKG